LCNVNIAVVVSGGRAELLQAGGLIQTLVGGHPDDAITVIGPCGAMDLGGGLPGGPDYVFPSCLDTAPKRPATVRLWWVLRRRRFDHVYLCTRRDSVRLAAFFAGISRRIGLEGGWSSFLLSYRGSAGDENIVAANASLAGLMGYRNVTRADTYSPSDTSREKLAEEVSALNGSSGDGPLVAIAPGGQRSWPRERFAHLVNQLGVRHGARVVVIGDEDDRDATDTMLLDVSQRVTDMCGKLSWDENAALLARCDLCISSDPTVLHLAAGVGCATLGLFGKGDAKRLTPPGVLNRAIESTTPSLENIRIDDALSCIEIG
jgi:ADP-heptose:LPS heptosyltransferase